MSVHLEEALKHLTKVTRKIDDDHPAGDDVLAAVGSIMRLRARLIEISGLDPCPKCTRRKGVEA